MLYQRTFLILLFILSVSGCSLLQPESVVQIPDEPLAIDNAFQVASSLKERDEEITSFKGLYTVGFRQDKERWKLRQVVVFQRPKSLRVETLPQGGAFALNVLVTKPGSARYLDNIEKRVVEGEELEAFFRQFFKLPAGEKEVMSFFTGRVPSRYLEAPDLKIYEDLDAYILVKGEREHVWRVTKNNLLVSHFEVRNKFSGKLFFTVQYEIPQRHMLPSGRVVEVPSHFSLHEQNQDFEMNGTLETVQIGQEIRPELFTITVPQSYSRDKGV